jgi:hypothetical protein
MLGQLRRISRSADFRDSPDATHHHREALSAVSHEWRFTQLADTVAAPDAAEEDLRWSS